MNSNKIEEDDDNDSVITKCANTVCNKIDEHKLPLKFQVMNLIMMSIVILMLISTNAFSTQLPKETKDMLSTTSMSVFLNVSFILFTIVWSEGKVNISPFTSTLLSIILFTVFLIVTRLPKYYFLTVLIFLVVYFIIHHMKVYRYNIVNDNTPEPQNFLEKIHYAISHDTYDKILIVIFYVTVAIIIIGFVVQFSKEKKNIPGGGLFATLKKMFENKAVKK